MYTTSQESWDQTFQTFQTSTASIQPLLVVSACQTFTHRHLSHRTSVAGSKGTPHVQGRRPTFPSGTGWKIPHENYAINPGSRSFSTNCNGEDPLFFVPPCPPIPMVSLPIFPRQTTYGEVPKKCVTKIPSNGKSENPISKGEDSS